MITVARFTPLADTATTHPVAVVFAAGGFLVFLFCLIAGAAWLDRWLTTREARAAAAIRRHGRRIGHGLGAENRRIDAWVEEDAPRP